MAKLYENELTTRLLDLMKIYREAGVLARFLEKLGIPFKVEELEAARFDAFRGLTPDGPAAFGPREVDGVIELPRALIFIEAKRAPNRLDKQQLIDEFRLGIQSAPKGRDFYLVAIDESVVQPVVIDTVQHSTYAKVRQDQIKWISWHQITELLHSICESYQFEGVVAKRCYESSLEKFREQGFGGFEGFSKRDLQVVRGASEYLKSLDEVNGQIANFLKQLQGKLSERGLLRLYKVTEHKRKVQGGTRKKKVTKNVPRLDWQQRSVGIGHGNSSLVFSYTIPLADKGWSYDLRKDALEHHLYVTFDLASTNVSVGYFLRRPRAVKSLSTSSVAVHKVISGAKYRHFNRKPLMLSAGSSPKTQPRWIKASELTREVLSDLAKGKSLSLEYQFGFLDDALLQRTEDCLIALRNLVTEAALLPAVESSAELPVPDEPVEDEEITGLDA